MSGLTQRRPASGANGASAPPAASKTVSTPAVDGSSLFSSNPSKRRGEIFFLAWGAVWISMMATIVATRMFEVRPGSSSSGSSQPTIRPRDGWRACNNRLSSMSSVGGM
jgi:hypothetical protein